MSPMNEAHAAGKHPPGGGPIDDEASILDGLADAFIAVTAGGTVTAWNVAAMGMFGWSAEEAIGSALAGLIIPPEARAAHQVGLQRAVASGQLARGQAQMRRAGGPPGRDEGRSATQFVRPAGVIAHKILCHHPG